MKIAIKHLKIQRVEVTTELDIPSTPLYLFETGARISIRVIPIISTFNSKDINIGDILELDITCISRYNNNIEKFRISINKLPDLINSKENNMYVRVSKIIFDKNYLEKTEEQFNDDLNNAIEYINTF